MSCLPVAAANGRTSLQRPRAFPAWREDETDEIIVASQMQRAVVVLEKWWDDWRITATTDDGTAKMPKGKFPYKNQL